MEDQKDNNTSIQYFERSLEALKVHLHDMDPLVLLFIGGLSVVMFVLTCQVTGILRPVWNWYYAITVGRLVKAERELEQTKARLNLFKNKFAERELEETKTRLADAERELEETKTRLSAIMGSRIRDNNPNIVNLGDEFRPTKLGEMSSELYDNEWTDAYDVLENINYPDTEVIRILLDIIMTTYQLCKRLTEEEWGKVKDWIHDDYESVNIRRVLKDGQKARAVKAMSSYQSKICKILTDSCLDKTLRPFVSEPGPVRVYVDTCVKLCLLMVLENRPLVWECPMWRSITFLTQSHEANVDDDETKIHEQEDKRGATYLKGKDETSDIKFDTSLFKPFTADGEYVQYAVWPAMLLHEKGPIMQKGIAQGFK